MKLNFFKVAAVAAFAAVATGCSKSNDSMTALAAEVENADPVALGVAENQTVVFVNEKGQQTSEPENGFLGTLHSGLALAVTDTLGNIGYVNSKGEFKIQPKFKDATDFNGGLAIVSEENEPIKVIDAKGNVKFALPDNAFIAAIPRDGVICYGDLANRAYFMTTDGKQLLPNLEISNSKFFNYNGKYLIYTTDSDDIEVVKFSDGSPILHSVTFDAIRILYGFNDNFLVRCDSKWGVVNSDGKFIINPRFEWINLDGDMYVAKTDEGKYCWFDLKGETVIKPKYKEVGHFFNSGDYAIVSTNEKSWTVINRKGESIFPKRFDEIKSAGSDHFFVKKDSSWGIVNLKGEYTAEPQFGNVEKVGKVLLARPSATEGFYGVISPKGEYLTDRIYVTIPSASEIQTTAFSHYPTAQAIADAAKFMGTQLWIGQPIDEIPYSISQQSINDYTDYCDGMLCIHDADYYGGKVNMNIYANFENGGIKWTYRRGRYLAELVPTDKVSQYCVSIQTKGNYELGAEIYKILTEQMGINLSGNKPDKIDVFTIQYSPDNDVKLYVMDSANPTYEEDYE